MHWEYFFNPIIKWWQQSKIRTWALENPSKVFKLAGVSGFILICVIVYLLIPTKQPVYKQPDLDWYYDLNTGELFKAAAGLVPPIPAPSGPDPNGLAAGVKAFVYQHPNDPNGPMPFLAYLQTTAPGKKETAQAILNNPNPSPQSIMQLDKLLQIKRIKDQIWFPADSPQAKWITTETLKAKYGYKPVYFPPTKDKTIPAIEK